MRQWIVHKIPKPCVRASISANANTQQFRLTKNRKIYRRINFIIIVCVFISICKCLQVYTYFFHFFFSVSTSNSVYCGFSFELGWSPQSADCEKAQEISAGSKMRNAQTRAGETCTRRKSLTVREPTSSTNISFSMKIQLTYRFRYDCRLYSLCLKKHSLLFGNFFSLIFFYLFLLFFTHCQIFVFHNAMCSMARQTLEFIACKYDECLLLDNRCTYTHFENEINLLFESLALLIFLFADAITFVATQLITSIRLNMCAHRKFKINQQSYID